MAIGFHNPLHNQQYRRFLFPACSTCNSLDFFSRTLLDRGNLVLAFFFGRNNNITTLCLCRSYALLKDLGRF